MKAQTASRLVNHEGGLIKSLSSNLSDELINRRQIVDEENLVSYKESENNDFTEFFNLFSSTTSSLENRLQIIENARKDENGNLRNPLSVFESNLETVCDTAHLASIREGEYNKILPTIQANLTMLQLISYISSNKDIEKTIQYIKDNIKNFEKVGIKAKIRLVDSAQFQKRLDSFDFDLISLKANFFVPPGAELRSYYGSLNADIKGSANWAGISDPVVDYLIEKVVTAKNFAEITSASKALDRVLSWKMFYIPQWYNDKYFVSYWDKFEYPAVQAKYSIGFPYTWWLKNNAGTN